MDIFASVRRINRTIYKDIHRVKPNVTLKLFYNLSAAGYHLLWLSPASLKLFGWYSLEMSVSHWPALRMIPSHQGRCRSLVLADGSAHKQGVSVSFFHNVRTFGCWSLTAEILQRSLQAIFHFPILHQPFQCSTSWTWGEYKGVVEANLCINATPTSLWKGDGNRLI